MKLRFSNETSETLVRVRAPHAVLITVPATHRTSPKYRIAASGDPAPTSTRDDAGEWLGPCAFSEEDAWSYAAEKLYPLPADNGGIPPSESWEDYWNEYWDAQDQTPDADEQEMEPGAEAAR
jgi:hypothetical protein